MSDENVENNEKLNWQRLAITAGIVLVTAAAVGGTVWYLMDQNAKSVADSNAKSIAALETQTKEKASAAETKTGGTTGAVATKATTTVVAFEPEGLFTEAEKTEIRSKITDAYVAYSNEKEFSVVSVLIHKYAVGERPAGLYMYSANAVYTNSGTSGWLFGEEGKTIEYWKPECMGECQLTDGYKLKYPNNF